MPNIPDARGRILNAATKIFAEKSFEGSRIDDIADTAKVPKSLIYYHFKSKEDILQVLIDKFLYDYMQLLQIAKNDVHSDKPKTIADRLENHYSDFASKNIDLIRIMLMESLKKNTERPAIFKVVEELVKNDGELMKADSSYDKNERFVAEFFTSLVPIYSFLCYQKQWCDYFNIDQKDFDRLFLNLITQTHGAYHKNHEEAK